MPRGVRNNVSESARVRAASAKTPRQKHARYKYDWDFIDECLQNGCSGVQVAAAIGLGCPDTLYRAVETKFKLTFSEYRQQKIAKGEAHLLSLQHQLANEKNCNMLIWLGKNRLGQRDTPQEIEVSKETLTNFKAIANQLKTLQENDKATSNTDLKETSQAGNNDQVD